MRAQHDELGPSKPYELRMSVALLNPKLAQTLNLNSRSGPNPKPKPETPQTCELSIRVARFCFADSVQLSEGVVKVLTLNPET